MQTKLAIIWGTLNLTSQLNTGFPAVKFEYKANMRPPERNQNKCEKIAFEMPEERVGNQYTIITTRLSMCLKQ